MCEEVLSRFLGEMGRALPERIGLIGYRGSGKTSVGKALARSLSWTFLDTDEEIETREGMRIHEIVSHKGWEAFRRREREVIERACREPFRVIATGGGAVLDGSNVAHLRRNGLVVWLRADAGVLLRRTSQDPSSFSRRPPLTGLPPEEEIRRLLQEREPYYRGASDLAIETQDRSIDEVVRVILGHLFHRRQRLHSPSQGSERKSLQAAEASRRKPEA